MQIDFNLVADKFPPQKILVSTQKAAGKQLCSNCRKTMEEQRFFKTRRTDKFPSGFLPHCRNCLTLEVDDNDPATFLPILKEIDVPYIPKEWRDLVMNKGHKADSILGKYVSKMRLNQFKKYVWADTPNLVEQEKTTLLEAFRMEGKTETEAEKALDDYYEEQNEKLQIALTPTDAPIYGLTVETSKYNLTQEEIEELKVTWGDAYNEDDYLFLEQEFQKMQAAYIISDPLAVSNAKMICKMTLKMNKFLDIDDIEASSKMARQLDTFIKTANLAPIQQKDRQQVTFAISQLAAMIERDGGFIPEYYIEKPMDKIDMVLADMKMYTEELIRGETNIAEMVENTEAILAQDALPEAVEDYSDFELLESELLGDYQENVEEIEQTEKTDKGDDT